MRVEFGPIQAGFPSQSTRLRARQGEGVARIREAREGETMRKGGVVEPDEWAVKGMK